MSLITTRYDFDTIIDRSNTQSAKWDGAESATAFSVAEMEFAIAPEILEALHERVNHGIFGYTTEPPELKELIVQRMKDRYNWDVDPEHLVFVRGVNFSLHMSLIALSKPGDGVLLNAPIYGPFPSLTTTNERFPQYVDMRRVDDDAHTFHYEIDFDAFEDAIIDQTSVFMMANPHNPGGRAFTREELEKMAEICLRHNVMIASDEIHCDILMDDNKHIPIASLSPEVEKNTLTMMSATKGFSLAGLPASVAIITDPEKRELFSTVSSKRQSRPTTLSFTAFLAAFRDGDAWLESAIDYINTNRDIFVNFVREELAPIKTTVPEATYLAWLDVSGLTIPEGYADFQDYLMKEAQVRVNEGTFFGPHFAKYNRFNFATPRAMLEDGLQRMKAAVDQLK